MGATYMWTFDLHLLDWRSKAVVLNFLAPWARWVVQGLSVSWIAAEVEPYIILTEPFEPR